MKTIIYTLAIFLSFSSCKSVDKLVKKGKYEEAFYYSLSHFEGSKKRETKDVKALERAFVVLTDRDLAEIEWSRTNFGVGNYAKIVRIYENLMQRQKALKAILPIISKDGYEATFIFKDYTSSLKDASLDAATFYYENGIDLLSKAKSNHDKNMARKAYEEFSTAENYIYNFRDVRLLKEASMEYGHKYIYLSLNNKITGRAGLETDHLLWNFALSTLNDEWHTYLFMKEEEPENADMVVVLDLDYITISPEKENSHHFTEQKEILVKTDRWFEKRDSIEIEVVKEYHEIVTAKIMETIREKNAVLDGGIRIIDASKNALISEKPIQVHFNFFDRGMVFHGDARALTEDTKRRLDPNLDNFPYDEEIVEYLVGIYKNTITKEVRRFKS